MGTGKGYGGQILAQSEIQDQPLPGERKFTLIRSLRVILRRKGLVVLCLLTGCILGITVAVLIMPSYTAKASFLPPTSPSSNSSALMSQLGQLGGLGATAGALGGLKDPGAIYIGILESRTVADDIIGQFHLQDVYKTKKLSATEKALANHTKFVPGKDTLVKVNVVDRDPQRAAAMANAYLKALSKQNDRLALTDAAQRRTFFAQQLEQEKNKLADAEVDFARETGLIHPIGQEQVQVASIGRTRAAIASREIELTALSQGATAENPEVIRLTSEISGLKEQLRRLESSSQKDGSKSPHSSGSEGAGLTLESVRTEREVKYQEALYALLLRQYESAQLDASRSAPLVQIVDEAVVPDQKSGPPRTLIVLLFAFLGASAAMAWAVWSDNWAHKMSNPDTAAEWQALRDAARIRGSRDSRP
jgi:tyrosine-protein kinase Etk/Wzc